MIDRQEHPNGPVAGDLIKRAYIALISAIRSTEGSTEAIAQESWELFRGVIALAVCEGLSESDFLHAMREQVEVVSEQLQNVDALAGGLCKSRAETKALVRMAVLQTSSGRPQ